MNQTNIHLFTTRTNGKYKGLLEGTAQWFENLERFNMMKTLSDTPNTYTFTATLPNYEQAQRAGSALIGYMVGTYDQSVIDITYSGNGDIDVEYTSDEDLTESFERIVTSFEHTDNYDTDTFKLDYHNMRVSQLKELDKDTLINDLVLYELELLDHADRLLSDEPLPLDPQDGYDIMELLGDDVLSLVKFLDIDKQFDGIHDYVING
ncbi:hypothetical protein [Streptococcus uberis]|uniref:hypothetical protein n=1 Tax=Streptococcus uberis TaxID=1349 RepID=UPI001FF31B06|nr:hypothetical protein [Streptococcus uberis]MCK1227004.1 hypothetical protein [Streptococcus uberis]